LELARATAAAKNTAVRPTRIQLSVLLLLMVGLVLSSYLLSRSLALMEGARGDDVCSIVFGKGCDATLADPLSKQLGVPLAGWGALYFGALLALLLLGLLLRGRSPDGAVPSAASGAASVLALTGGFASLGLLGALLFGNTPLCPLCLVVNGVNLAALWPILHWRGEPAWAQARQGVGALKQAGVLLWIPLAACVLFVILRADVVRREAGPSDAQLGVIVAEFRAQPITQLKINADDPVLGPATAKIEIVIFSDAFCPHCRRFWEAFMELVAEHKDDVRVIYKHFPLDATCNPLLKKTVHQNACAAAQALEAARMQGTFWKYEEALRAPKQKGQKKTFGTVAAAVGLDVDRFAKDIGSGTARRRIRRDVEQGIRLKLKSTPAVFVGGRRVHPLSPKVVRLILEAETSR